MAEIFKLSGYMEHSLFVKHGGGEKMLEHIYSDGPMSHCLDASLKMLVFLSPYRSAAE